MSVRVKVSRTAESDCERCSVARTAHFCIKLYTLYLRLLAKKRKQRGVTGNTDFVYFITYYYLLDILKLIWPTLKS